MHARNATLALLLACCAGEAAADSTPQRYAALMSGGQRVEGYRLSGWQDGNAVPHLGGQPLLAPDNPFRWLRDRSRPLAELPPAYVEFHNGDRLPGTVIDYRTGLEQPLDPRPAHFLVRVALDFEPPDNKPVAEIRVAAHWVRRIVWQRRGQAAYQPGAALYRDGRTLPFRAARFHSGEAHLLLEGGDEHLSWSDLAELHLPAVDSWTAYFDELATLCLNHKTRLIAIETTTGLVATSSLERLAPRFEGNSGDSDRWVHGLAPAWSLDLLWIPFRTIACYRSFASHEVPLSRLRPRSVTHSSGLGGRGQIAVDRSPLGTPLRSKSLEFGWGLGVSGGCEIAFDLPAGVRSLRTTVCLDRTAGGGGCIRPRIYANEARGAPLWEGPVLVGSENVVDSGHVALNGKSAVVLQIDPLLAGKPAGADPLDIRDHADWCDPVLELDAAAVQTQLDRRLAQRFEAWRDWEALAADDAGLELTYFRDDRRPPPGEVFAAVRVKQRPLVLRRELTIHPSDQWLVIAATRLNRGQEPLLEVRIGGEAVAELRVPERQTDPSDNKPLAISLAGYAADQPRKVLVEIRQSPAPDSGFVNYRSIAAVEHLPTLFRVVEEQAKLTPIEAGQTGTAEIIADDRHYGIRALRVTSSGQFRLELSQPILIRERPLWGEARFIRFAVKKQGGGRASLEIEDGQGREQPARYDLGPGLPSYGSATRIWQDNLPKDWVVLTRDLFADFGNLDAKALIVGAPDGEAMFLDHVYLARNPSDFDLIPAAPSPALVNEKARQDLVRPIAERAPPAIVRIEFEDGRKAAGVIIEEKGEILTAGHVLLAPNRECRVILADGKSLAAKTLGIARDFDLGLVRIVPDGRYPRLDAHGPNDLPQNQAYLAFSGGPPQVAQLRRVFRSTLWTDLDPPDWLAGGPLLDQSGRIIAVQVSKSRFGGILGTRLQEAWNQLGRMRNSEVFGAWPAGSEPLTGCEGAVQDGHYRIISLAAAGPAATSGLAAGDAILKQGGRAIATADDWQRALAEHDAGQEIAIEFSRGKETRQAKLKLAPRVP